MSRRHKSALHWNSVWFYLYANLFGSTESAQNLTTHGWEFFWCPFLLPKSPISITFSSYYSQICIKSKKNAIKITDLGNLVYQNPALQPKTHLYLQISKHVYLPIFPHLYMHLHPGFHRSFYSFYTHIYFKTISWLKALHIFCLRF